MVRGAGRLLAIAGVLLAATTFADDEDSKPKEFPGLKYRLVGPAAGGRVCRACGRAGRPAHLLRRHRVGRRLEVDRRRHAGSRSSTTSPPPRSARSPSRPSDPNVVYVGSGEANIRGNVAPGNGIYKSTDAGKTWKHVWKQDGQIGTMIVHPTNPDVAFAAVLGTPSARTPSAASTAPPTAARPGSRSSRRTPTPARPTSASTRTTRASCSPASGRRGGGRGS